MTEQDKRAHLKKAPTPALQQRDREFFRAAQARQSTGASTEVANLQQALTREKARSEDADAAYDQDGG